LRPAWANSSRHLISKITRAKWTGGVAQVVECLLCKRKERSNPSPTKKNSSTERLKPHNTAELGNKQTNLYAVPQELWLLYFRTHSIHSPVWKLVIPPKHSMKTAPVSIPESACPPDNIRFSPNLKTRDEDLTISLSVQCTSTTPLNCHVLL
jgi:hypothetical protein